MKKIITFILLAAIFTGAGCVSKPEIAAVVNGEKILYKDVEKEVEDLKNSKPKTFEGERGQEFEKEIFTYVLQTFIDSRLILQEAKKENAVISLDTARAEVEKVALMYQSREIFLEQLKAGGLTLETFTDLYQKNMTIKAMRDKVESGVKVTDDEAEIYYKSNTSKYKDKATGKALEFESVKDIIKKALLVEKREKAVAVWIEGLRKKADIKINI